MLVCDCPTPTFFLTRNLPAGSAEDPPPHRVMQTDSHEFHPPPTCMRLHLMTQIAGIMGRVLAIGNNRWLVGGLLTTLARPLHRALFPCTLALGYLYHRFRTRSWWQLSVSFLPAFPGPDVIAGPYMRLSSLIASPYNLSSFATLRAPAGAGEVRPIRYEVNSGPAVSMSSVQHPPPPPPLDSASPFFLAPIWKHCQSCVELPVMTLYIIPLPPAWSHA